MLIKKDAWQFIRSDSQVAIGSEGIIGDKLLKISQGSIDAKRAKEGQQLESSVPVETGAIMESLQVTAGNVEIISEQLAEITMKINRGKGTLGRLIQDTTIAENLNQTIVNLKKSSKGLNENMNAAKDNILLKGYFKKKERAAKKKKEEAQKAAEKEK